MEIKRITRSVLADASGRLLERSVQRGPKDPPWRNLTREEDEMTMAFPKSFLYKDGEPIVRLKKVTIDVSTNRFVVGEECSVRVRGELEPEEKVKISVNGETFEIDSDDMLLLTAETPGIYAISLSDDRFWADVESYTVMAIS